MKWCHSAEVGNPGTKACEVLSTLWLSCNAHYSEVKNELENTKKTHIGRARDLNLCKAQLGTNKIILLLSVLFPFSESPLRTFVSKVLHYWALNAHHVELFLLEQFNYRKAYSGITCNLLGAESKCNYIILTFKVHASLLMLIIFIKCKLLAFLYLVHLC